jgi:hypothetical protein
MQAVPAFMFILFRQRDGVSLSLKSTQPKVEFVHQLHAGICTVYLGICIFMASFESIH